MLFLAQIGLEITHPKLLKQPPLQSQDKGNNRTTHAYPGHDPTNRASRCGGEGGTGEQENQSKVLEAPRKAEPSQETAHTLLIALMNLSRHFHPDLMMLMMMMHLWTLHELHKTRWKAKERKARLQQLLLQRNAGPATLLSRLLWDLLFSSFVTTTPRTFPRAQPPHQGVVTMNLQKEGERGRVQDI